MKINITKKEYRTLLEAMELASWVLHAHAEEERKDTKPFRELEQKICSFAKEFGMEKEVFYDPKLGEYMAAKHFEDYILQYIDEYNADTFWDELIERLVMRDLILEEGAEKVEKMGFDERFQKENDLRLKYETEFERHGLDQLKIDT